MADVRLPPAGSVAAPVPLVLFLHGGFWFAEWDRKHTGPLAAGLVSAGYAVCAPEFRRIGQDGGGWPGTFDDVSAAVDRLPGLVEEAAGPQRVAASGTMLAGHSAGGHLALWAAGRHRLPPSAPWHKPEGGPAERGGPAAGPGPGPAGVPGGGPAAATRDGPVAARWRGVVALAAVSDLRSCFRDGLGDGAAAALMEGSPERHPERYAQADPAGLLPLGVPVRLVHGSRDDRVPCAMSRDYTARAAAAGDAVVADELAACGHFELIDPLSAAWPAVLAAFRAIAPPGRRPPGLRYGNLS